MISMSGNDLLIGFSKVYKSRGYQRIDYCKWRDINETKKINIKFTNSSVKIIDPIVGVLYELNNKDNSLGEYCYETFNNTPIPEIVYGEINNNDNNKENDNSMKMFEKIDFGPVDESRVQMSPYGMAIKNKDGEFVAYNASNGSIVNVDGFCFSIANAFYKMPVALSAVTTGDIIIHQNRPCFVEHTDKDSICVIDIIQGEAKTIIPTTNMFNFNFVTKIISLFNLNGMTPPDASNPFGNIMPMMIMSEMMNSNESENGFGKMMMMSMMMGGQNPFAQMFAGFQPTGNQ